MTAIARRPCPGRDVVLVALTLGLAAGLAGCGAEAPTDPAYLEEIERYRADRADRLRAEDGWLTLAGLFWLEEGENSFGSDRTHPIVLPPGSAPARAGSFVRDGERVTLLAESDSTITLNGDPVVEHHFHPETPEGDDVFRLGRLRFNLIRRNGRPAIRLKDPESPVRTGFRGLDFYPVDERFRLDARLRPYDEPVARIVPTVAGTEAQFLALGQLEFELDGRDWTLEGLVGEISDEEYFIIFQDLTSGETTYGAGRYLVAPRNEQGAVLDFNRAYNPPCAFTPYATCPLPPPGNRLDLAIEAGERTYGES